MTSGIGEGVAVGGTGVGAKVTVGLAVWVGLAVELGAGVSVGSGIDTAVTAGVVVLVARVNNVGSGLGVLSENSGLQAPKTTAMSSSRATPVFVIRSPPNLISLLSSQLWSSVA
jgi:hypothetical protein